MPALSSGLVAALEGVTRYDTDDIAIIYSNSTTDPYEAIIPAFTYAMPVQVVVLGVTITLLSVLFVHLLFTIRYHMPLSKLNYAFQCTAVVITMAKTSAELHLLMSNLQQTGQHWPFTYDYIEVMIPPSTWSLTSHALWTSLTALNSLAIHVTHIQFLTMLFPSGLEAKLILTLLGPLALASSFLIFTDLADIPVVTDLGDAIRNTANSTLTLLYTLAIFIWGLTLNRSRAWRTEGGTATFGIMALSLGVSGTAINFLEVKEERMRWLPGVVSCILLWQSWVGFWWWVGSGMWAGEAEDVERKERKRLKRAEAKKKKREGRLHQGQNVAQSVVSATGSFANSLRRRNRGNTPTARAGGQEGEQIELTDMRTQGATGPDTPIARPHTPSQQQTATESVSSGSTPPSIPHILDPVFNLLKPFLTKLRVEHDQAAVAKAAQPPGLPEDVRRSWGLRALMMRGRRERGERRARDGGRGEDSVGPRERQDGFEVDGGQRLEESDWESEGEDEGRRRTTTGERYPPRRREGGEGRVRNTNGNGDAESQSEDFRGRGMDGQRDWWWRGAIAKWRLNDVREF